MNFRIRIVGLEELVAKTGPETVRLPVSQFLHSAAFEVEAQAKMVTPVDTGRLRASIHTRVDPAALRAVVGTNVVYAPYVEFGTRPHWPPIAAMQPWARRHGFKGKGGAFLVARAIARRGTRARRYMERGAQNALPMIENLARQLGDDIAALWRT